MCREKKKKERVVYFDFSCCIRTSVPAVEEMDSNAECLYIQKYGGNYKNM